MYVYVSVCGCIFAVFLHVRRSCRQRHVGGEGARAGGGATHVSERPRSESAFLMRSDDAVW